MPINSPLGWDLPAGCTDKDIDNYFGSGVADHKECPECAGLGKLCEDLFSPPEICNVCGGKGEVKMTQQDYKEIEESIAEAQAEK